jgi:hypothetical protein
MNWKFLFAAAALIAISGCTAMDKMAGLGVVSQHTSTFDNATVIEVSPNSLYDPGSAWGTPLQLGARWSSAAPDSVALVLAYNSSVSSGAPAYLGLSDLGINIDGTISSYSAGQPTDLSSSGYNTVSHTIYTSSKNAVVIPYSVLQRMVAAKDCRLRIHTSKGYQDINFSAEHIPGGKATAIVTIKEFMAKVDAVRGNG